MRYYLAVLLLVLGLEGTRVSWSQTVVGGPVPVGIPASPAAENQKLPEIKGIPRLPGAPPVTLKEIVRQSALIFEGILEKTEVVDSQAQILLTKYTFQVTEPAAVAQGTPSVTVSQAGGVLPDGSGMTTGDSLWLREGGTYIVALSPDWQEGAFPFLRVFQVYGQVEGDVIADEQGCPLVAISEGGTLSFSAPCTYPSLTSGGAVQTPNPGGRIMGPPVSKTPGGMASVEATMKRGDRIANKRLKKTLMAFLAGKGGTPR